MSIFTKKAPPGGKDEKPFANVRVLTPGWGGVEGIQPGLIVAIRTRQISRKADEGNSLNGLTAS